jgi:fatty acid desaturase
MKTLITFLGIAFFLFGGAVLVVLSIIWHNLLAKEKVNYLFVSLCGFAVAGYIFAKLLGG